MISSWKIIRNLLAIAGAIMIFSAISTSDYYVVELGQAEPTSVWKNLIIGVVMTLPVVLSAVCELYKEGKQDDNR